MANTTFSGPVRSAKGFVVGDPTKEVPPESAPLIISGAGAPTVVAPQGTLYINTTGSTASTRIFINVNGATGWTPLTAGA